MDPASQTHCILLLDLPANALAGIDLLSFTSTPRFKGVKNLPPGLHFVWAGTHQSLALRHGAWFYVSPGAGPPQVFVKKWSPANEDLLPETDQTELLRSRANLGALWKDALTPYRQTVQAGDTAEDDDVAEESSDWGPLTSQISQSLLTRICGLNPDHWALNSVSSAAEDVENIPGLEASNPGHELAFFPVDLKQTWPAGTTGRERTEAAQDRSWALGHLIDKYGISKNESSRELEILGELQFCFLMILTLNNNSCLEQWKRLLRLLFTCCTAVKERSHLFVEVIKTLRLQLSHCADMDATMFDMDENGGGFLRPLLRTFRKNLDGFDGKRRAEMVEAFEELDRFLQKEFGWELDDMYVKRGMLELEDGEQVEMDVDGADEEDETGDYAPTVVELTRAQMEALNGTVTDGSEEETELDDMDTRY